jgi:transcriptional regulator with XRE-family HTH domain
VKEINIGTVLLNKRREKGITQDELANYIGVSKAAISKWETAQSYPDITLLPILAAYFNISLDELMGYEPQMTKEDIKTLYNKICEEFVSNEFDNVIEHCHQIMKKYYACFPLLLHIGLLFVNHSMLAGVQEKTKALNEEAKELFHRIQIECDDVNLAKQANHLEAFCCIMLNDPKTALVLLENTDKPQMNNGVLLSSAYQMIGQMDKAKTAIQVDVYQNIINTFCSFSSLLMLYVDDEVKFQDCIDRVFALDKAFEIRNMHPGTVLPILLAGAQGYTMQGHLDKALDMLQLYTEIITTSTFPFTLHGNEFFDKLDDWFKDLDLGTGMPRSKEVVKQSMLDAVCENPIFAQLNENSRFNSIVEKLKRKL